MYLNTDEDKRICRNCKHTDPMMLEEGQTMLCNRLVDFVTGLSVSCRSARATNGERYCGPMGKFYEAREVEKGTKN